MDKGEKVGIFTLVQCPTFARAQNRELVTCLLRPWAFKHCRHLLHVGFIARAPISSSPLLALNYPLLPVVFFCINIGILDCYFYLAILLLFIKSGTWYQSKLVSPCFLEDPCVPFVKFRDPMAIFPS